MSPARSPSSFIRDAPLIAPTEPIGRSARACCSSPSCRRCRSSTTDERYAGIFGEREFITALFPGYVGSLKHAGFVPKSIDTVLEKRQACRIEPVAKHMNTEHVDVAPDFSDVGLAEIFIHHRVLIIPVTEHKRVVGVITRSDFFTRAGRALPRERRTRLPGP